MLPSNSGTHGTRAPPFARRSTSSANPVGEYFFDQLLDHTNPSLGTFKQRYFFSDQYFGGQGSPIILATPGEQSIDGFQPELNGPTLQYAMMQVFGAAGIVLERECCLCTEFVVGRTESLP